MSSTRPHQTAPLTLTVAHSPSEIDLDPQRRAQTVYIVVDVIRATTTLAVMAERGVRRVMVAPSVEMARKARTTEPTALLAGEVNAVAPPDFDYGNSPAEWGPLEVAGREVVFSTSNGARALHAAMGGGPIFAGSLRNATAVCTAALKATQALESPQQAAWMTVVCSGLGGRPSDDDSLCAGWLIQTLRGLAAQANLSAALGAGAQRALDLLEQRRASVDEAESESSVWLYNALDATEPARMVREAGLGADLAWCADVDASNAVPMVAGEDVARLLLFVEQAPEDVSAVARAEGLR